VLDHEVIETVEKEGATFTVRTREGRSVTVTDVPPAMLSHFADWLMAQIAGARVFEHVIEVETGRASALPPSGPPRTLPGGNDVHVAGESFHFEELRAVVGPAGSSFGATLLWASLVPDPTNPYDKNAVKVMIDGRHVGNLSKEAASAFVGVATRIRELGCDARCAATIIGGGREGVFGVVLDLGTPDECLECLSDPRG